MVIYLKRYTLRKKSCKIKMDWEELKLNIRAMVIYLLPDEFDIDHLDENSESVIENYVDTFLLIFKEYLYAVEKEKSMN